MKTLLVLLFLATGPALAQTYLQSESCETSGTCETGSGGGSGGASGSTSSPPGIPGPLPPLAAPVGGGGGAGLPPPGSIYNPLQSLFSSYYQNAVDVSVAFAVIVVSLLLLLILRAELSPTRNDRLDRKKERAAEKKAYRDALNAAKKYKPLKGEYQKAEQSDHKKHSDKTRKTEVYEGEYSHIKESPQLTEKK